jgi:hypothetical protein
MVRSIKREQTYKKYIKTWGPFYVNLYVLSIIFKNNFTSSGSLRKINFLSNYPVFIHGSLKQFSNYFWPVKYENSSFNKFIDLNFNRSNAILFLRKNKIFNKGRYSRNRQLYRTGVYMCLWINVIFIYFYLFAFYRFTFNFGFMWVGIGLFILSMTFGRAARYRFYNFKNFLIEFYNFSIWLGYFFQNIIQLTKVLFLKKIYILFNFFKSREF